MEVDGVNLAIGGGAVGAIAGVVGAWIKARYGRTQIDPDPLNVKNEKKPVYVTVGEFNTRLGKVEADIKDLRGTITTGNNAVMRKLDEIDARSEKRANELNRRIDPVIERVAANKEAVDMLKDTMREARRAATLGGMK